MSMTFFPIYSHLNYIPAFYLEGYWSFFRYLFHNCLAGGSRVDYRLWEHYLGAILPLMWQVELVQCIECRDDECFLWKFLPTLICTSHWPPSASNPMAFVAYLLCPEKYLFLGLLGKVAILGFPDPPSTSIVPTRLSLIRWTIWPNHTSGGSCWLFLLFRLPPS